MTLQPNRFYTDRYSCERILIVSENAQLQHVKVLIGQRRYVEARQALEHVSGPKADEWRRKLDERLGVQPVNARREIPMPPSPYMTAQPSFPYFPEKIERRSHRLQYGLLATGLLVFLALIVVGLTYLYVQGVNEQRYSKEYAKAMSGLGVYCLIVTRQVGPACDEYKNVVIDADRSRIDKLFQCQAEADPIQQTDLYGYCLARNRIPLPS